MKWEYKHLVTDTIAEGASLLNGFGEEGWELVAVAPTDRAHSIFIFKRPKDDPDE